MRSGQGETIVKKLKKEQQMKLEKMTRRDFSERLAGWVPLLGVSGAVMKVGGRMRTVSAAGAEEISRTNEAIHQEVTFKASPARVYEALTDSKQFDAVTKLSAAMTSGMVPAGSAAASVSREAGGAFSALGGDVSGRHIQMSPGPRIGQALPDGSRGAGVDSISVV